MADHSDEARKAAGAKARCPFRRGDRRKQFAAMIKDYVDGNSALLYPDGRENRRNNVGVGFWRGFHDEPFIWDAKSPMRVAYWAGAAIAEAGREQQRAVP